MQHSFRLSAAALSLSLLLVGAPPSVSRVPLAMQPVLQAITPANLKGDLSFLSSDALAGRYTPSPGLDVAAEFIASQFRAAGLKPAGDDDYFQTAPMIDRHMPAVSKDLTYWEGGNPGTVRAASLTLFALSEPLKLDRCPVLTFPKKDPELLKGVDLAGKAVVAPETFSSPIPPAERQGAFARSREFDSALNKSGAKLEILVGRARGSRPLLLSTEEIAEQKMPVVVADSDALKAWLSKPTGVERTVSLELPGPEDQRVTLKNVIGVWPGSDPKLKDTYILLTAHYDHVGTVETAKMIAQPPPASSSDRIYNGANDDGSGTVSVIEIARAFAAAKVRPNRSLVFITFFGEERGDIGSGYYGAHPIFPLSRTIADINLEQVGRTDSTEGKQLNNLSVTGFDYSDVTKALGRAGEKTGITVYLNKQASDAYFERSDNAALAQHGVPAHTLCVAFDYSDYHGVGDVWTKIDYDNMAKVDRAVALGLWDLAASTRAPQWNAANPKTAPFREAQRRSQEEGNNP